MIRKNLKNLTVKSSLLLLLVVVCATLAILELTNTTHFFHKNNLSKKVVEAGTSTSRPKPNVSGSQPEGSKTTSTANGSPEGGSIDTNGQAGSQTSPSQWVTSASGNVTVKQPVANAKFENGSVLSGIAKVSPISWRLIDNQVGVIAQGTLSVVNGSFSGKLEFTSHSSNGRLDVFTTDSQGVEYNEVQIAVSF